MIRRAAAALAATAAVALAAAGCAGGAIGQNTALSNGQSFVSGTGTSFLAAGTPAAGPGHLGKDADRLPAPPVRLPRLGGRP